MIGKTIRLHGGKYIYATYMESGKEVWIKKQESAKLEDVKYIYKMFTGEELMKRKAIHVIKKVELDQFLSTIRKIELDPKVVECF